MGFRLSPNPPWSDGVLDYDKVLAESGDAQLRVFSTTMEAASAPSRDAHGLWQISDPSVAGNFSAVAWLFGQNLRRETGVPIGLIVSAVGGSPIQAWMDAALVEKFPRPAAKLAAIREKLAAGQDRLAAYHRELPVYLQKAIEAMKANQDRPAYREPFPGFRYQPSFLFNAIVAPFCRYPITGFVWYQGESDSAIAEEYGGMFRALISDYRAQWRQPDAPFLFVQLANYDPVAKGADSKIYHDSWARQRAAQAEGLKLPKTGMVVAADAGHPSMIHPRDKKTVADRLVRAALSLAYQRPVAFAGPCVASASWEGQAIVVTFQSVNQLKARDTSAAATVEVEGMDGIFIPAPARLAGDRTIRIDLPAGVEPVAVRYAWGNNPSLWIYDIEGLPAAPFSAKIERH
jgi:sialate O-acetylesterase